MESKFFVRIGVHVVNADNVISFQLEGSDIVQIWYVGSETPLVLKPAVPAKTLLDLLQSKDWLL
jgi:hypothetical protein